MSNLYRTSVNKKYNFDITTEDVSSIDTVHSETNKVHLIKNNTNYDAEIRKADYLKKTYEVRINNTDYNVVISDKIDVLIKDMGFTVGAVKHVNNLKAPMPGLILEINVSPGQEVKEGDPLLILSAMKMENVFASSRDGIIKSVLVKKDDAIEKGQLLIEFEA